MNTWRTSTRRTGTHGKRESLEPSLLIVRWLRKPGQRGGWSYYHNMQCVANLVIQDVAPPAGAAAPWARCAAPPQWHGPPPGFRGWRRSGPGALLAAVGAAVACSRRPAIQSGGVVAGRLGNCARCGGRWVVSWFSALDDGSGVHSDHELLVGGLNQVCAFRRRRYRTAGGSGEAWISRSRQITRNL